MMFSLDAHFGFDTDVNLWPMTVETDGETLGSLTIPVERHDGTTEDIRFVPEEEVNRLKKILLSYADMFDRWGAVNVDAVDWLALANDLRIEVGE